MIVLVVLGTDIKICLHIQLVDKSCSLPPGLGKMNLCLDVQTVGL